MRLTGRSHRHVSAAVKRVLKADDRLPLRVRPRNLDRILDRFRARVHKQGFLRTPARRQRIQLLADRNVAFIGQHVKAGMQEAIKLATHRVNHRRSAMSGIEAADAAGKIDQAVAVNIFDDRSFSLGNKDGRSMISRPYNGRIPPLHESLRARSRNRCA